MYFEFNQEPEQFFIKGATIVRRSANFSGAERRNKYGDIVNSEGRRNFLVELEPDVYEEFKDKGWNVGRFAARDDEDEPNGFIRINVSYMKKPVDVTVVSDGVETYLDEDHIHQLDSMNFSNVELLCSASHKKNKRTGEWEKNAFLDAIRVEVVPNRFAEKYDYLHRKD